MPHSFKVCILTAGKGNRLGEKTKYFNKALLRVGNKAVISHTIDCFDNETEFVIALGYRSNLVKQYLTIAHPEKHFTYVEVDKYSEPGSGPGYALLKCEEKLQCPFVYVSCDSMLDSTSFDNILENSNKNIITYDFIDNKKCKEYCTIEEDFGNIICHYDKTNNGTNKAFTGVAFVKDYDIFWNNLKIQDYTVNGEIQAAPVFFSLPNPVALHTYWDDVGNLEGLEKAQKEFCGIQNLDKIDEELYVVNGKVIKYFHNESMVKNRVQRAKYLKGAVPEILQQTNNYYSYDFIPGHDLFKLTEPHKVVQSLFEKTHNTIWKPIELDNINSKIFKDVCKKFYFDKTLSRLDKLCIEKNIVDRKQYINDTLVPQLPDIFKHINWDYLSNGIPVNFHGDYNFSNIIWSGENKFTFLDWRQDFGGCIEFGDVYYDLAKMYHSFLFPHESVKENKFYVNEISNDETKTFIEVPINLEKSKDIFENFVKNYGNYDLFKIKLLTGIVLLNMSPLHESPIDKYLFYFSKHYLYSTIRSEHG